MDLLSFVRSPSFWFFLFLSIFCRRCRLSFFVLYFSFCYCRFHFEVVDCIFITHSSHSSRIIQKAFCFFSLFFFLVRCFIFYYFFPLVFLSFARPLWTHCRQVTVLYFQFYSNDFYSDAISYFFHHKVCPVCARDIAVSPFSHSKVFSSTTICIFFTEKHNGSSFSHHWYDEK